MHLVQLFGLASPKYILCSDLDYLIISLLLLLFLSVQSSYYVSLFDHDHLG